MTKIMKGGREYGSTPASASGVAYSNLVSGLTATNVQDAVDEVVSDKADRVPLPADYDSTSTYAVGDFCVYNGDIYYCTSAISTPEAWNSNHWRLCNPQQDYLHSINPEGNGSFSLNRKSGTTIGAFSFAEGYQNTASGNSSHAEGGTTTASGDSAHAEGTSTRAEGGSSHAEGSNAVAYRTCSHAEGYFTRADGWGSHVEGEGTRASHKDQHVFGNYNVIDTSTADWHQRGNYVEIVGNGTANNARSNARTLDWSGNEVLAGKLTATAVNTGSGDVTLSSKAASSGGTDLSLVTTGEKYTWNNNSSLAGLSDVTLTTPTNNDVLKYDSTNNVWVNSNSITVDSISATSLNGVTIGSTPKFTDTTYSAGTGLSLSSGTFSVKTGFTTSGNNRAVQTDANGNLYVTQKDNNTTYSAGTGLSLSSTTFSVNTGYTTSGNNRAVQADSDGNLYVTQKDSDTKNTAGSTDTSSKIFLIGATSQAANPQTYSDNQVYAQSGDLTSNRFVSLSKAASYINKDQVAGLLAKKTESTAAWYPAVCLDTYGGGHWQIGNYNDEQLVFCYGTKTNKNAGTNKTQRFYLPAANNNNDLSATIAVYLEKTYSVTIGTNTYDGLYYADINVSATATNYHVLDLSVVAVTGNHWASITYYTTNNIRVWTKATGITVEVKVMGIAV